MSTAIAFLSGKGGSGKTTLALSMADLMSKCKIKTLLIDCDLSTNGATYFFESNLRSRSSREECAIYSFFDFLRLPEEVQVVLPTIINNSFHFLPSVVDIVDSNQQPLESIALHSYQLTSKLKHMLSMTEGKYDVVLFDCQAGYTELLPDLLPLMDVDIFVLEADSISASAMRNLHLKIGNSFGHAKLFQVFNKASEEEFEVYSKIVGTFFTNIGTLLFDWKIRQAFSRSQIPGLESVSAKYSSDLLQICKVVLNDTENQKRLNTFSAYLQYRQLDEERRSLEEKLAKSIRNPYSLLKKRPQVWLSAMLLSVTVMGMLIVMLVTQQEMTELRSPIISIIVAAFFAVFIALILTVFTGNLPADRDLKRSYERQINTLSERMKRLEREIPSSLIDLNSSFE